ncbi:MAG: malto-oligosyltrehalose trehalohydrolase [Burkholderiales bacterium]
MPFGAEMVEGGVRFNLWAPSARSVELCLESGTQEDLLPLETGEDGWHTLTTRHAAPGSHYRYRIDREILVPDPASRFNLRDVPGPSIVVDPLAFEWQDDGWRGRPWVEAVLYEMHIGTFTPPGTFLSAIDKLGYLADLGVTALEVMPVADFPGRKNWGYDGVLLFAPDSVYGTPEDFKRFIQAAHDKGIMVLLDVVYNHFGPEGNYLHLYARQFFTEHYHTPWGAAINFDQAGSRQVRDFYVHNALYWLEEFRLDGLRLDAVHAIRDDESEMNILCEIAQAVRNGPGRSREIHLILENDHNAAHFLNRDSSDKPMWYTAQWNDDAHHALHVLLTGEAEGYYCDYAEDPIAHLGRALSEGFSYQGQASSHRGGMARGEKSIGLPLVSFVNFLQNHDQVGNNAFGHRLNKVAGPDALRAATAILLLSPSIPLIFMGQEFAAAQPFPFFCDFAPPLAELVTEGRRREFERFPAFRDPAMRLLIPDPNAPPAFQSAVLDWLQLEKAAHREWLDLFRDLLKIRHAEIVPRLKTGGQGSGKTEVRKASYQILSKRGLRVEWKMNDGSKLTLVANLQETDASANVAVSGRILFATHENFPQTLAKGALPAWSTAWYLQEL